MGKYISVSEKEWNGLQMKVPSQSTSQHQSVIQVIDKVHDYMRYNQVDFR